MNYIIDSYAWIEYFLGSKKGEKVREIIKDKRNFLITVDCCLAEIAGWALEQKIDFSKINPAIISNSTISQTLPEEWIKAAEKRFETRNKIKDFGLIDSVLLVKQEVYGGKILSGDRHFKNIKNIEYVRD